MKLGQLPLSPILPVLFSYLDQPQASHTAPCSLTFCSHQMLLFSLTFSR